MTAAPAVTIAYIHSDEVAYSWYSSMLAMLTRDMTRSGILARGGVMSNQCGAEGIAKARNDVAGAFLEAGQADWLLWLDTDMGFPPDTAERLLEAADPVDRPVVGALCFIQLQTGPDGMGGWQCMAAPTIYDLADESNPQGGFHCRFDYPRDTLTRCAGTGCGCLLIHRSVFAKIAAKYGPVWHDPLPSPVPGQVMGEDLSFCARAGAAGIPVHVHTGVSVSHMKRVWLSESSCQQGPFAGGFQPGLPPIAQRIG